MNLEEYYRTMTSNDRDKLMIDAQNFVCGRGAPVSFAIRWQAGASEAWKSTDIDGAMRIICICVMGPRFDTSTPTRCHDECYEWTCAGCCRVIRSIMPDPPTIEELIAARDQY